MIVKIQIILSIIFLPIIGQFKYGHEVDSTKARSLSKRKFHLFILAGQSNMAGRGEVQPKDKKNPERVFKLNRHGNWVPATDPVHYDKPIAGVGPGRSFGIALAHQDTTIKIGLIPCAVGGSSITTWKPGAFQAQTKTHPYDDCLVRIRQAMKKGILKAILWHQGAADSNQKLAPEYKDRLYRLVARLRRDLNTPDLIFISGQLAHFEGHSWNKWRKIVNKANASLSDHIAHTAFVSSDGLTDRGDGKHFDSASARKLGRRYAKAYIQLKKKDSELKN